MKRLRLRAAIGVVIVTLLVMTAVVVGMNHGVSAIRVFQGDRGTRAEVTEPAQAFVGLALDDEYTVPQDGEQPLSFDFTVTNNLGVRVDYVVELEGVPIGDAGFSSEFELLAGAEQQVTVPIDENVFMNGDAGTYDVTGTLLASWDNGQSEVELSTQVEVQPLPSEPEADDSTN